MTPAHLDARRRKDLPRRASLYGAAFLLPVALLCLLSAMRGVYPFGPESFLTEDLKYQYIDFFHWYRKVLTGQESLFYSFSTSLGNNAWGLWSYYLASPLNLLVLLFPDDLMTLAVFLISAIKLGLTGVTTTFYLRNRFSLGAPMSLALEKTGCLVEILATAHVPTSIAVQTDDVGELRAHVLGGIGHHDANERAGTFLRIELFGKFKQRQEIICCLLSGRIRFIGNAPHNNAGKILITGNQVTNDILMMFKCLNTVFCSKG